MSLHPFPRSVIGLLTLMAIGVAGCSSYQRQAQAGSAFVHGTDNTPLLNTHPATFVGILQIDGSSVGMLMTFNSGVYLSPGTHEVLLTFNPMTDQFSTMEDTVTAPFAANHRYRFSISGDAVDIILWDETAGPAQSVKLAEWDFGGSDAPEQGPISRVDLHAATFVRPSTSAVRKAGPPPIPHAPRPGGGGQKHSGGGGKKK